MSDELKDSGTVTALSVIGLVFGLVGMLGSFIPCIGSLAFYIGIPAAIVSGIALIIAHKQKAKRTFAIVALTISLIGVVISGWQYFSIMSAGTHVGRELRKMVSETETPIIIPKDDSANVKRAHAEINIIATALADYFTDRDALPDIAGEYVDNDFFFNSLVPLYVKKLPIKDPWGNNYRVYCGKGVNEQYGIMDSAYNDFLVVSIGSDHLPESWKYMNSMPDAGLVSEWRDSVDLINYNGAFIRGPRAGVLEN